MASFTTNYNLDLYEAGDIPNLLDQYNGAMGKVDTALASINTVATAAGTTASNAATAAATADGKAVAAQGTADQALSLAQTNESDITSLETTVQQHTTSITAINGDISELNAQVNQNASDIADLENEIQDIGTAHRSSGTITVPSTIAGMSVATTTSTVYKDTALHLMTMSLQFTLTNSTASNISIPANTPIFTLPQGFRPATARTLQSSMIQVMATTKTVDSQTVTATYVSEMCLQVNTDGTVIIVDSSTKAPRAWSVTANSTDRFIAAQPCIFTHEWGASF